MKPHHKFNSPENQEARTSCLGLPGGLAVIVAALALPLPAAAEATDDEGANRYNVLFIAIDDLRNDLGVYGAAYVETPNIDRLAGEGVVFNRHYTAVPTCGASRYALLTGRSPASTGMTRGNHAFYRGATALDPAELSGAQSMPELFRRSGYFTVGIGKISHMPDGRVYQSDGSGDGREELPHAWDELATPFGPWGSGWGAFFGYAGGRLREQGIGGRDLMEFVAEEDDDLPDGLMATAAIEQLGRMKDHGKPFFMGLGFYKPHLPFVAPRQDWEAVAEWDVPDADPPERIDSAYWTGSAEFRGYDMPFEKTRPFAPEDRMKTRRAYLACVRYIDRQVGRVLDALDQNGLAENTVVVLWSDHGFLLGEFEIWGKHTTFELASRAPLIIRGPEVNRPGRRSDAFVESIDLLPTLVDLTRPAFRSTVHPLDGRSLAPILRDETDALREGSLTHWARSVSVRTSTHRLIATATAGGGWENIELYEVIDGAEAGENLATGQPELVQHLLPLLSPSLSADTSRR